MTKISSVLMRYSRVAVLLLASGCSHSAQRPLDGPTPVKPNDVVTIWTRAATWKWHGVVVTQDSVSGIPHEDLLSCSGCRLTIPRTSVDSMKVAYKMGFRTLSSDATKGLIAFAALLTVWVGVCQLAGSPHNC